MIELTNGQITSGLLRHFACSSWSRLIIPSFARTYNINQEELGKSLAEYPSLHEFFIRRLKDGIRPIDPAPLSVISPVDAVIEDAGTILPEHLIKVKDKVYSILEMVGSEETAKKFTGGTYIIFYLSPSHYHRIHSPVNGTVTAQWALGKKSYPVNRLGLKYGKSPLSKNYRSITQVRHESGSMAIVKVGAMFVNSIEALHRGEQLIKGEEIAYFTFGSTVVLLFEKDSFQMLPSIQVPKDIKVGEKIGDLKNGFQKK